MSSLQERISHCYCER